MKNLSDDFPMTLNMLRDINARVKNPTAPWHKIVPVMDMVIYIKKEEV